MSSRATLRGESASSARSCRTAGISSQQIRNGCSVSSTRKRARSAQTSRRSSVSSSSLRRADEDIRARGCAQGGALRGDRRLEGGPRRVDSQRKELRDIEGQFTKLRKSADDVNEKMNRFVAEKRRIDALEGDYKRLLSMSQSVELKLEHVTGATTRCRRCRRRCASSSNSKRTWRASSSGWRRSVRFSISRPRGSTRTSRTCRRSKATHRDHLAGRGGP